MEEIFHPSSKLGLFYSTVGEFKLNEPINTPSIPIGCVGATVNCITHGYERIYQLVVNGIVLSEDVWGYQGGESGFSSLLSSVGIQYLASYGRVEYVNTTNEYKRVEFNAGTYIGPTAENTNPTLHQDERGWTLFCLGPSAP